MGVTLGNKLLDHLKINWGGTDFWLISTNWVIKGLKLTIRLKYHVSAMTD